MKEIRKGDQEIKMPEPRRDLARNPSHQGVLLTAMTRIETAELNSYCRRTSGGQTCTSVAGANPNNKENDKGKGRMMKERKRRLQHTPMERDQSDKGRGDR